MMICCYCGETAPENPVQSCCGEIHFEEAPECPECGSLDVSERHHEGNMAAPECYYMACGECGEQWGHE